MFLNFYSFYWNNQKNIVEHIWCISTKVTTIYIGFIIEKFISVFNLIGYSVTNNILPDNTYLINFDQKNLIEKYNLDN